MAPSPSQRALRPLVVGQAPATPGREGRQALLGTASGRRLAQLAGLDDVGELLRLVDAVNVSPFWLPSSLITVRQLRRYADATLTLVGWVVAKALETDHEPPALDAPVLASTPLFTAVGSAPTWVVTPHPSGRNRYWNDPGNVERAAAFWRRVARDARAVA